MSGPYTPAGDFTTGYGIIIDNMLDAPHRDGVPVLKSEGGNPMDFYKVPIGFGMALAMNQPAMNAYAAMTEQQKQTVLNKAHNVRSEKEMHDLVASLANGIAK